MANWISEVVGKMHVNKITNLQLAKKLGVTPEYVSMILNEKKSPKGAEAKITQAVEEIIVESNIKFVLFFIFKSFLKI